ncbi:MAG: LLM class F420-dependent oxidoreductase [Tepidiformaceae bacterium]
MKIGLFAPFTSPLATPAFITAFARTAEEAGFHSLWAPEHVVLFDEYGSRYPYSEDGRLAMGRSGGVLEPWNALAFAAAVTSRIRLGTGICLVPQRNPVYTAKEVATVDWLSGGRVDFGVGIGWLREEFAALGVPWERRGARTRAYLEVMRRLWTEQTASYDGEFYRLESARQDPKPVQQPHPPIHFGGESDAALRRVADIGQGWYGFDLDPAGAKERIGALEALLARRGRKREEIVVSVSPFRRRLTPESMAEYGDAGVDQLIVPARLRSIDDIEPVLSQIAGELGTGD